MRADIGALVALDAFVRQPRWYIDGNAAFFIGRCSQRIRAVFDRQERAHRQGIAILSVHRDEDAVNKGWCFFDKADTALTAGAVQSA